MPDLDPMQADPPRDRAQGRSLTASLALHGERPADSNQIAEKVLATCRDIDVALTPIVGPRGVAAIHKRSLQLAGEAHPWLRDAVGDGQTGIDPLRLRSAFSAQGSAEAAEGGAAFLTTFYELLATLVGRSLTARLLDPVWVSFPGSLPSQGPP